MQIGGPDSTIRSINASRYPLMRRTWDAANAGCWLLEVACMHGRASEGKGEGPPSHQWHLAAAARAWQATQGHPTAKSGFPTIGDAAAAAAASAASSSSSSSFLQCSCVVSCCAPLGGWVASLCRVGSRYCVQYAPGSRGTDDLGLPVARGRAVRYILPVHGDAGLHSKKCGEGIRIAAPDSNFGRLVGWQWVGAGPDLLGQVQSTVDQAFHPSPGRWYRATEQESQRK